MNWLVYLTDVPSVCALISEIMTEINMTFWIGGYMTNHLATLGMDENAFGYLVAANMTIFILTCVVYPFTCESLPRRFTVTLSVFGMTVTALMIGPSNTLGLPDNAILISIGALLQGIFNALPPILGIPEGIERLTVKLQA